MRLTIFVTLLLPLISWSQVGLNGRISTQSGFTRTQLERESNAQTNPPASNGNVIIYGGNPSNSCLTSACSMAGTFGCDEQNEITELKKEKNELTSSLLHKVQGSLTTFHDESNLDSSLESFLDGGTKLSLSLQRESELQSKLTALEDRIFHLEQDLSKCNKDLDGSKIASSLPVT